MYGFLINAYYQIWIRSENIVRVTISCPDQVHRGSDLLAESPVDWPRYDPREHLRMLKESGSLADPGNPLLVCGIRNIMSNHRCIVYTKDNTSPDQDPLYSVEGEKPICSQRPYYIMAEDTVKTELVIEDYMPSEGGLQRFRWFFSGVPVLWDNLSKEELFQKMLLEASDHSIVYDLPRGSHPEATDDTRWKWSQIHDVFIENLYKPSRVAFQELYSISKSLNLKRCANYMHSIIGIDSDKNILLSVGRGKPEELGKEIRDRWGVERAILVGSAGSITLLYYPAGVCGHEISLFAIPSHRRPGTAFMVVEMRDNSFGVLRN